MYHLTNDGSHACQRVYVFTNLVGEPGHHFPQAGAPLKHTYFICSIYSWLFCGPWHMAGQRWREKAIWYQHVQGKAYYAFTVPLCFWRMKNKCRNKYKQEARRLFYSVPICFLSTAALCHHKGVFEVCLLSLVSFKRPTAYCEWCVTGEFSLCILIKSNPKMSSEHLKSMHNIVQVVVKR